MEEVEKERAAWGCYLAGLLGVTETCEARTVDFILSRVSSPLPSPPSPRPAPLTRSLARPQLPEFSHLEVFNHTFIIIIIVVIIINSIIIIIIIIVDVV